MKDKIHNNVFTLPPEQASFLWKLSWLSLVSGIYATIRRHYTIAPGPICIWLTSLNYWRNPVLNSMRRKIDIFCVNFFLVRQLYITLNAQYAFFYWIIIFLTLPFYPLGCYWCKYDNWLGTYFHSIIHIGGNIGNIIVCTGYI